VVNGRGVSIRLGTWRSEFLGHPGSSVFWFHPYPGVMSSPMGSERSDEVHELAVASSLAARISRMERPLSSILWAAWISRSQIESEVQDAGHSSPDSQTDPTIGGRVTTSCQHRVTEIEGGTDRGGRSRVLGPRVHIPRQRQRGNTTSWRVVFSRLSPQSAGFMAFRDQQQTSGK